MSTITISTLPTLSALQDTTYLATETAGITQKVTGSTVKTYISTAVLPLLTATAGNFTYSNISDNLTVGNVTVTGNLAVNGLSAVGNLSVGNVLVSGNVYGTLIGGVSGTARYATLLSPGRSINGVLFDGSADITLPVGPASTAPAGTLFGSTLASVVVYSSLTTVGILANLTTSGNIIASRVSAATIGNTGAVLTGTLSTAAQTNITSLGTLSGLAVGGTIAATTVNAATIGNTGAVLTGTLSTAAQPNITSLGTLSGLTISGNVTAGNVIATGVYAATIGNTGTVFNGTGTNLVNLSATNIIGTPATANVSIYQQLTNSGTNASFYVPFYNKATGNAAAFTNTSITVNPSSGTLTASAIAAATGTFTTVNRVTLTSPATGATITVADGKTLSATNSLTFAGTDGTTLTFPPSSVNIGYLEIPQVVRSAGNTLISSDSGKFVYMNSAGGYTIPANSSVPYPIGTVISFVNVTGSSCTIAISTDTMYIAGSGATGTRTLGNYGSATALKITATSWLISGINLT